MADLRRRWSTIPRAGLSWGCVSAVDAEGRTTWIGDANRSDGKRFIVHADEKLTAFLELESAIHAAAIVLDEQVRFFQSSASAKRI